MASYRIEVKASAEKELRALPKADLGRLIRKIQDLALHPRPANSVKLKEADLYRVRQGDWRVVYEVDDLKAQVTVVRIGHRREVYRK